MSAPPALQPRPLPAARCGRCCAAPEPRPPTAQTVGTSPRCVCRTTPPPHPAPPAAPMTGPCGQRKGRGVCCWPAAETPCILGSWGCQSFVHPGKNVPCAAQPDSALPTSQRPPPAALLPHGAQAGQQAGASQVQLGQSFGHGGWVSDDVQHTVVCRAANYNLSCWRSAGLWLLTMYGSSGSGSSSSSTTTGAATQLPRERPAGPPCRSPATNEVMGCVRRLKAPSESTYSTVPSGRESGWYSLHGRLEGEVGRCGLQARLLDSA